MPKTKAPRGSMVIISIHIPKEVLRDIDELVRQGRYPSRAELIRVAVRDMLDEMRYRQPQQQQQQQDPPADPPEDPPSKTKAEEERERSMRYRACVERLLNTLLANLGEFRLNVKHDGAYKIPKKIIVGFFTEDCRMNKSVVAPAYNSLIKAFMKAGFSVAETPHAFILRKEPEVVMDA